LVSSESLVEKAAKDTTQGAIEDAAESDRGHPVRQRRSTLSPRQSDRWNVFALRAQADRMSTIRPRRHHRVIE